MSRLNMKWKLVLLLIIALTVMAVLISTVAIYEVKTNMTKITEERSHDYREAAYNAKKDELRTGVDIAVNVLRSYYKQTSEEKLRERLQGELKNRTDIIIKSIEGYYQANKGRKSEKALKNEIMDLVRNARYGQDGYFWINDMKPNMVMHPLKPSLDGSDLSNTKDPEGRKIFVNMVDVVKQSGEGFVSYSWDKPGYNTPQPKLSYVVLFKPYGWIIGTGEYLADVTKAVQEEALETIRQMRFGQDNSNYFWINDFGPNMIMHPVSHDLEGTYIGDIKDTGGMAIFREMVKTVTESGKGFVTYYWQKEGAGAQPKLSYVAEFKEWGWIIGTGAWTDDIEAHIKSVQDSSGSLITRIILYIIGIAVSIIILLSLVMMVTILTAMPII